MRLISVFFLYTLGIGLLTGCAINVSPATFIQQDQSVTPMDITGLHNLVNEDDTKMGITRVKLTNAQGITLRGVALAYPDAIANIVIYPGNGMTVSNANTFLHRFSKLPANILMLDYQGMGASEKAEKIKLKALQQDALQVYDYATEVFQNDHPILVHGVSMGSILAAFVASERDVEGVVLDGAIDNVPELVDNLMPAWSKVFTRIVVAPELANIDNSDYVSEYYGPLLILAGEKDKTTPLTDAETLYQQSPSPQKTLLLIPEATHAKTMKYGEAITGYQQFIRSITQ